MLKGKGSEILLKAKPLGRPSATAVLIHVSPGECNPIEGKFGQAKTGYGLNRIKARLKKISELWIAGIILVLNLIKLAGIVVVCLLLKTWSHFLAIIGELFDELYVVHEVDNLSRLRFFPAIIQNKGASNSKQTLST